jgi:ribosomal protein L11 methyltransferase
MSQIELSLHTTHEGVDWVRSLLAANGYRNQLRIHPSAVSTDPPDLNSKDWAFTLRLYLPNDVAAQTQVATLTHLLSPLHRTGMATPLEALVLESEMDVVKLPTQRIGRRFVIATDWSKLTSDQSEILIQLPSSLAFGSGFHPATQLVLELLEQFVTPTMKTLDLGCGSGILSVAMAKLGATVLALDNDPTAIAATQAAVELNRVSPQVKVVAGSLGQGGTLGHWLGGELVDTPIAIVPDSSFDLIAANVLGRIHVALAADYWSALRTTSPEGGFLITAGFTDDYADEVNTALVKAGFASVEQVRSQEWVAFAHRRSW